MPRGRRKGSKNKTRKYFYANGTKKNPGKLRMSYIDASCPPKVIGVDGRPVVYSHVHSRKMKLTNSKGNKYKAYATGRFRGAKARCALPYKKRKSRSKSKTALKGGRRSMRRMSRRMSGGRRRSGRRYRLRRSRSRSRSRRR